jgi:hypothetical protein
MGPNKGQGAWNEELVLSNPCPVETGLVANKESAYECGEVRTPRPGSLPRGARGLHAGHKVGLVWCCVLLPERSNSFLTPRHR